MEAVSPEMQKALEQKNEEQAQQAARTGESAIPVPITPPQQVLEVPDMGAGAEEDPLERWRKIQEERQKREAMQARPTAPQTDPNAQIVDKLANSMSQQMQTILDAQSIAEPQSEVVTPSDWLEKKAKEREEKLEKAKAEAAKNQNNPTDVVLDIIQPAGTIEYAQLITEANSDVPGPVLAQVMSGPLVGARLLGSFKVQDEYLVLTFGTIVIDGVSYGADVIALDPSSANPGLVTEIDQRYFRRIILPAAAAFIEGMGEAIAESGSTTVSVTGETVVQSEEELDTRQEIFKGVEEASGKVSEILDKDASKVNPLVKVHAGTAIGVLFMQPVTKEQGK
jgi:intracellular multiplication protein IcmE